MNDVLYSVCRVSVSLMDGWHPVSSTSVARMTGLSIGKVKYQLQKLKNEGLIYSFSEGGQTEDGYAFCYHGYQVTDEGRKTEEYHKAALEEEKLCVEIFGEDMRGYAKTVE